MRYIITGRVQPERADISFGRVEMSIGELGKAAISCDSSQITVVLNDSRIDGWISATMIAEDLASIVVSGLGFSLGSGYSVELVQITQEDGTPQVLGVRPVNPEKLGETLAFDSHIPVFNRAIHLAARDIFFRIAVRDYLAAINDKRDCATYCYRAIESLKSSFVRSSGRDGWDGMHSALGTDRDSITMRVKQYADPVRHGNWVNEKSTDEFIRWKMLALTRDILSRYLDLNEPPQAGASGAIEEHL
jgi:hypothetical protein